MLDTFSPRDTTSGGNAFGGVTDEAAPTDFLVSPFGGLTASDPTPGPAVLHIAPDLESPFSAGLAAPAEMEYEAADELFATLEDEDFTDAVGELLDAAAAANLASQAVWSDPRAAGGMAEAELHAWAEPLIGRGEQLLETFAERLDGIDLLAMTDTELDEYLAGMTTDAEGAALQPEFEDFLGGLINKAKSFVQGARSVVHKGIAAVKNLSPMAFLLRRFKKLIRPLVNRVLRRAIGSLDPSLQPIARRLATQFGFSTESGTVDTENDSEALVRDFDGQLAELLLAPDEAEVDRFAEEADAVTGAALDPITELDSARDRLGRQLSELAPGADPIAEIEQFVPVAMAAMPIFKMAVGTFGRDRVVQMLATPVAKLIRTQIGADAARRIARPIVDVGMRMMGLEVTPGTEQEVAGEALASTVEETIRRTLEQTTEALTDELQLNATVQQAFAESAAAYLPDRLLRNDLPERETAGEGAAWVLMPRTSRPRYRYRKCTRVYVVPISQQVARVVPWRDGGTLETHLADRGVQQWPVMTEVHLYEALPGTQLGHLRLDEGLAGQDPTEAESEPQELTPEMAGLLVGEPGLGARSPGSQLAGLRPSSRPAIGAGGRFFRVRVADPAVRRRGVTSPRRRVQVRFDLSAAKIVVLLRLSERQGQEMLARLTRVGGADLPGALQVLQRIYRSTLPVVLVTRLLRHGLSQNTSAAAGVADKITAAVSAALSENLRQRASALTDSVRAPAQGLTVTVTFTGVTRADLTANLARPTVTATPGWRTGA